MANNRMFLVHDESGQRVMLATHFAGPWKVWIEEQLVPALTKAFLAEAEGSTSWHIEYEHHGKHDDPLMPSTTETWQGADGAWHLTSEDPKP